MNEADTCRVLITPALQLSGWGAPVWRIAEQYYFTDGQVILVGDGHRRQKGKKADYLLRYEESFPIAEMQKAKEKRKKGSKKMGQVTCFTILLGEKGSTIEF